MLDKKISELTEITTPAPDDELVIVDKDIPESKKITVQNLRKCPGMVVLINADETEVTGAASNGAVKTYSLAVNTYAKIIIEAEVALDAGVHKENEVQFNIEIGDVVKRSLNLRASDTGPNDNIKIGGALKYSQQQKTAATIDIAVDVISNTGTWRVKSLRVYGVV